ncbi:hypothetical protein BD408DRAFT_409542 [Parasitella parasitica]|nr:hypothetical protein BD408DRAFT_409542 [Parasitella parasitica]
MIQFEMFSSVTNNQNKGIYLIRIFHIFAKTQNINVKSSHFHVSINADYYEKSGNHQKDRRHMLYS